MANRRTSKHFHVLSPFALIGLASACLIASSAAAVSQTPQQPERQPRPEQSRPEGPKRDSNPQRQTPAEPKGAEGAKPAPGGDPAQSAETKPPPAPRSPQTAAEKHKLLADLYAQLATAEDEATANKFAGQIERLWTYSGSETTTLLIQRAGSAIKEKRLELAQKLLDHATQLAPDHTEVFNQRAYYHFAQGNFDAAVGDLRRVIALDPNHFKALEGLAQIWRETGNKKGALGVLKQLIDVHPFANGAKSAYDELKREVEGQGI